PAAADTPCACLLKQVVFGAGNGFLRDEEVAGSNPVTPTLRGGVVMVAGFQPAPDGPAAISPGGTTPRNPPMRRGRHGRGLSARSRRPRSHFSRGDDPPEPPDAATPRGDGACAAWGGAVAGFQPAPGGPAAI